jgi:hypothetical protein
MLLQHDRNPLRSGEQILTQNRHTISRMCAHRGEASTRCSDHPHIHASTYRPIPSTGDNPGFGD